MDKISDSRIDIADDNEPAGHIGTAGEELDGGKVQNHDDRPIGNGFDHRPFPATGTLLFCHGLFHFEPLSFQRRPILLPTRPVKIRWSNSWGPYQAKKLTLPTFQGSKAGKSFGPKLLVGTIGGTISQVLRAVKLVGKC